MLLGVSLPVLQVWLVPTAMGLEVALLWVLAFRFPDGRSAPGSFLVHIRWVDGRSLRYDEFAFTSTAQELGLTVFWKGRSSAAGWPRRRASDQSQTSR